MICYDIEARLRCVHIRSCGPDVAGKERRRVMKVTAIALASTEKAQWAFYERRFRPEEKVHQPWIDRNDRQVVDGLRFLDGLASRAGDEGWLAGTERLSQADITGAVVYTFAAAVRPHLACATRSRNWRGSRHAARRC
jgi:hypothetical protein